VIAVLASFVLALPFQFALTSGYFAVRARSLTRSDPVRRRRLAAYARASRTLGRAAAYSAPWSVAILVAGIFSASIRPSVDPFEGLRLVAAAATVSGGWIAIQAGRTEARGQLRRALSAVRIGGRTMCGGVVAELILAGMRLGYEVGPDAHLAAGIAVFGLIALGGFVALLAALTGKPRPSVTFAVLFYLAGRLGSAFLGV